jgi:hypothetical protein
MKYMIKNLETDSKKKKILRNQYRAINKFKKGNQLRCSLIKG